MLLVLFNICRQNTSAGTSGVLSPRVPVPPAPAQGPAPHGGSSHDRMVASFRGDPGDSHPRSPGLVWSPLALLRGWLRMPLPLQARPSLSTCLVLPASSSDPAQSGPLAPPPPHTHLTTLIPMGDSRCSIPIPGVSVPPPPGTSYPSRPTSVPSGACCPPGCGVIGPSDLSLELLLPAWYLTVL